MDDTTDFLRAAVHRWGVLLGSAYNVQGGPGVPTPQALGSRALALAVAGTLGAALLTVAFFFFFHSFSSPGDDSAWGALVRGNSSVPPDGSLVVELSHGWTRYKILGQEHPGPLVVLIHGLLGLSENMEYLGQELAGPAHKRRVLIYDIYGRGWSTCDGTRHTAAHFAGQLAELLFAIESHGQSSLGGRPMVDLVGWSMGGLVAAKFAATFGPARVRSLACIAPAGTRAVPVPLHARLVCRLPAWLAEALAKRLGTSKRSLVKRSDFEAPLKCPHFGDHEKRMAKRPEVEAALPRSLVSTLAHFELALGGEKFYAQVGRGVRLSSSIRRKHAKKKPAPKPLKVSAQSSNQETISRREFEEEEEDGEEEGEEELAWRHKVLAEGPRYRVPTLLLWGKRDTVVPFQGAKRIVELCPHATVSSYEHGRHALPIERPGEVARDLAAWWESCW